MPKTILERIAAGDSLAVEECLQTYDGLVWSLARKFCSSHADAEDAVQEVFIEVWQCANRFDPEIASEATYIAMIARRRMIDRLRRQKRDLDTVSIEESTMESSYPDEEQNEAKEEYVRAKRFMQQLRPEQREIIEMSTIQGLSQTQISQTMNLPLGTVKTHARRGLLKLRELLCNDAGLGATDEKSP